MHDNIDQLKDLDVNMYIISGDTPDQQVQLYSGLVDLFGNSLPFVSDPDLTIIELFDMKNVNSAYRGYGMLDTDGTIVFHTINDNWGEQMDKTVNEIKEEYAKIQKD